MIASGLAASALGKNSGRLPGTNNRLRKIGKESIFRSVESPPSCIRNSNDGYSSRECLRLSACPLVSPKAELILGDGGWEMATVGAANRAERFVSETADAAFLSLPLRSLADIESIERTPLSERLAIANFCQRIDLAIAARNPRETAIYFVADGDVSIPAEEVPFSKLRR